MDSLLALAGQPLPIDKVHVPALHEDVWCQGLTALTRSRWERTFLKKQGSGINPRAADRARGSLLQLCVIRGENDRALRYSESDVETLVKIPAAVIEPVYDLCRKLSGIGEKDIEELEQLSADAEGSGSNTN